MEYFTYFCVNQGFEISRVCLGTARLHSDQPRFRRSEPRVAGGPVGRRSPGVHRGHPTAHSLPFLSPSRPVVPPLIPPKIPEGERVDFDVSDRHPVPGQGCQPSAAPGPLGKAPAPLPAGTPSSLAASVRTRRFAVPAGIPSRPGELRPAGSSCQGLPLPTFPGRGELGPCERRGSRPVPPRTSTGNAWRKTCWSCRRSSTCISSSGRRRKRSSLG